MSRRRKGRDVHGVILLDKPEGYSSNQAVQKVRWLFQARKAGHTGSLDPFATGLLPICLGEASKTAGFMLNASKTYLATALLGRSTETGDTEGATVREEAVPDLTTEQIEAVLAGFIGLSEQIPPMYSALKHKGEPLYKLARAGQQVERPPREITIHSLELLRWESPCLEFRVHCSKGTYVRTLAEDIAGKLGSCAHLVALRRQQAGLFTEQGMLSLDTLIELAEEGRAEECLLPVDAGLSDWPRLSLDEESTRKFSHGNALASFPGPIGPVRVYGASGEILGLGEIDSNQTLKAKRIFVF